MNNHPLAQWLDRDSLLDCEERSIASEQLRAERSAYVRLHHFHVSWNDADGAYLGVVRELYNEVDQGDITLCALMSKLNGELWPHGVPVSDLNFLRRR